MTPVPTIFRFLGYRLDLDRLQIFFEYEIVFADQSTLRFTETLVLPEKPRTLDQDALQRILDPLLLMLGISYYKLYCPPTIELPFALSQEQAEFWNTVYRKGLGEFLCKNQLTPDRIARFPAKATTPPSPVRIPVEERALLGIGGGKDSIVAAELLREVLPVTSFLTETQRPNAISAAVIEALGFPKLEIRRVLDPQLFTPLPGSYNGHIPISAVFACVGLLSAALYGYRYVVVGNEYSSNIGNLEYCGEIINHQWSKSAEFEALFQTYTRRYITPDITYFSVLRQFHEIRIAKLFAEHQRYFTVFSSCNRSFTVHKERSRTPWCGTCPKCAFVFLMLAPFFTSEELHTIFGKNLFADTTLIPLFRDLLGWGETKPFDCVGTFEEAQVALHLAAQKYPTEPVVTALLPELRVTPELTRQVFATVPAPTLPTPFRFCGIQSVCLLGYGKEGKVTEQYLRATHPKLQIGILDQSLDSDYLEKQSDYDLAIKTPGIPKDKVTIPYTTATNLFFAANRNLTIGVTGSKGKSTTTSLIAAMLRAGGKKVRAVGNLGTPMLTALLTPVDPEEIFVIELSSYMLDDIEYSPHIAVLLNLFPEHMNYHGSVERYYAAKQRIFAFQKPSDIAIRAPCTATIPLDTAEIPLQGEHNLDNLRVAITVAQHLGISQDAIATAIRNFQPLPHRLELVGTFGGITFYDDAISTTPESTIMAIKALPGVRTIFLGGEDRGYDFTALEAAIHAHDITNIVLFPDSGTRILTSRTNLNILETDNMEEAVRFAYAHTPPGGTCLLSTASPSYSLWKNFEEKGDLFQRYVRQYQPSSHSSLT